MDTPIQKRLETLWTVAETAKYLSMSKITMWRWIKKGLHFNPERIVRVGREIRIPRSEVERVAGVKEEQILSHVES